MLTRGDDTNAFGQDELLRINFTVPEEQTVSKAVLICGNLELTFDEPVSPIQVILDSEQTKILKDHNSCDLVLYDGQNRQLTLPCIAEFSTRGSALK
jgi:hypothetical protein